MSVNKVILIGRLGKDPETRYMTNGDAVTNVSLATSENFKDKNGEKQERTEWHNLVFYRRMAEVAGEYLKKGAQVYIEGRIQTRKWQDKEGKDRYSTEIIVNEMQMLGRSGGEVQEGHETAGAAARPAPSARTAAPAGKGNFDNFDDDMPFAPLGKNGAGVSWRAM